jgi:putative redox protein
MADATVELEWQHTGMVFKGGAPGGVETIADGNGKAAISPVQALLFSLASCTASDIVEILGKMRVTFDDLRVVVEGDRAPKPPRRYTAIRLRYEVRGLAEDCRDKLDRAIALSHEKYCSVLHSLRSDIEFHTDVVLG